MTGKSEKIQLSHIDTTEAAKNVAKLLEENKTYFLNGAWGSGKTTFLKQVEKEKTNKKKFIYLDLWKLTDKRSIVEVAFSKLHFFLYWIGKILLILSVALSLLFTAQFNLGFQNYINRIFNKYAQVFITSFGVIALVAAVYQFFKPKSDILYAWIFDKLPILNKILIIDDFDRLTEEQQKEAYKLFALLNGKLPIVFVGDFEKVYDNTSNDFLSKIIDRRIDLPFGLHPSNIWNEYFKELESKFDTALTNEFKQLFIIERRNLRDRVHFNDYVTKEFIDRNKFGHVQVEQLLVAIYIYLFYPSGYIKLFNDEIPYLLPEEELGDDSFPKILKVLLGTDINQIPLDFIKNKKDYYIYESPSNMTNEELANIFENEDILKTCIANSDIVSDFYIYLQDQYDNLSEITKMLILKITLKELAINGNVSFSVDFILRRVTEEHIKTNGEVNKESSFEKLLYIFWKKRLEEFKINDYSILLFILVTYCNFSNNIFDHIDLDLPELSIANFKTYQFKLLYLDRYSKDHWDSWKDMEEKFWEAVNSLSDDDFIRYWADRDILREVEFNIFQFNLDQNSDGPFILSHIKQRIDSLKKSNFIVKINKSDSDELHLISHTSFE
ncbi:P-loop NTPase fold protein [Streptococcus tangpeifui]|uniref:P-loop NTPase fold protein n=1 Tax=Streptococcus tangpeifui TaxID=2709400 RepID=UPI0013EA2291|nr:P-loop NTPase fold protein [Streptococcus sp. ZJ373]